MKTVRQFTTEIYKNALITNLVMDANYEYYLKREDANILPDYDGCKLLAEWNADELENAYNKLVECYLETLKKYCPNSPLKLAWEYYDFSKMSLLNKVLCLDTHTYPIIEEAENITF